MTRTKIAIIIGAGPAGLTAAYELLKTTKDVMPVIYEENDHVGGIAKTVNYKGNRMDMGGHRFFSKSDKVMNWWQNILPIEQAKNDPDASIDLHYQNKTTKINLQKNTPPAGNRDKDAVMLVRSRLSRIFFLNKFFDYPITLNIRTIRNLGFFRIIKIGFSYMKACIFQVKEVSLEDFLINKFGKELYLTFFKDYTEKVWGVPCSEISAEWGAQRIKGLSIMKAIGHMIKQLFPTTPDIEQKNTETSLIQRFLYPKLGPGQMWEEVLKRIVEEGGKIHYNKKATGLYMQGKDIGEVEISDTATGQTERIKGDYFFSTMPVRDLINVIHPEAPRKVLEVARGLMYRDFITVGLLMKKLKIKNETSIKTDHDIIPDNWIYIQEKGVHLGRLQIFNNWSPFLVKDPDTVWMGLEYFCNEGDELWNKTDEEFMSFAIDELASINIIDRSDVLDQTITRVPKAYPAYFGSYKDFHIIRDFTDSIENLFMIGRNGMHKYNNQDHSMLTAMKAVENIKEGIKSKEALWNINTEQDYHESK